MSWTRQKRFAAVLGILGITIELVAIYLLASKQISTTFGMPLVVAGMFIAFVPMFVMARDRRRR